MKHLIVWEKWVDPFGKDMDEAKWTDYDDNINDIEDVLDSESEDGAPKIISGQDPIKVIASPLGLIPYNEHTASGKIFNFWLGHTNFNISNNIKNLIEKIDGVEILDIFTRYRFRIAIGKCFNDAEVMNTINQNIHDLLNNNDN